MAIPDKAWREHWKQKLTFKPQVYWFIAQKETGAYKICSLKSHFLFYKNARTVGADAIVGFQYHADSKQIEIEIKAVQWIKSRIWEKKGSKHAKPLAKIQVKTFFRQARYPKKCFTQIYRDLYADAMLERIWMGSNKVAGKQQKHLSLSFATKP